MMFPRLGLSVTVSVLQPLAKVCDPFSLTTDAVCA